MFTLIGLGVGVAYAVQHRRRARSRHFSRLPSGPPVAAVGTYFEAAAVITTLVLLGQVLELRARSRTGAAIRSLLGLAPKTARLVTDGSDEDVPLDRVQARRSAAGAARAKKFPLTASLSRDRVRSMNP